LTKKFIDLIKQAEDGVLDLNKAADTLNVSALPKPLPP
jgi:transcription factor E2F3